MYWSKNEPQATFIRSSWYLGKLQLLKTYPRPDEAQESVF